MNDHTTSPTVTPDPDRDGVILHLPEITYLDTQTWAVDVGLTTEGLAALQTLLGAAPAVPAPPVDQPALREIAAQAIREAACTGDCGQTEEECAKERIQPFAWHHGTLAVVEGSPEQLAAAVLAAVLPAPVDRAALVRAAASFVRDTYSGEWADDAAATLETDADKIERGESCSLLRLAAVLPATTNHDTTAGGFELRGDTEIRAAALREAADWYAQQGKTVLAAAQVAADLRRRADAESPPTCGADGCSAPAGHYTGCPEARADETAATATEALSQAERTMLRHALDFADTNMASRPDEYTDADHAAMNRLRRLTAEQPAAGARQDGAQR